MVVSYYILCHWLFLAITVVGILIVISFLPSLCRIYSIEIKYKEKKGYYKNNIQDFMCHLWTMLFRTYQNVSSVSLSRTLVSHMRKHILTHIARVQLTKQFNCRQINIRVDSLISVSRSSRGLDAVKNIQANIVFQFCCVLLSVPTELVPFRHRMVSQHEVKAPAVTLKTGRPAREEQSGSTG